MVRWLIGDGDTLRGWRIQKIEHHGRPHWRAVRWGVSMNHKDKDGLINMILTDERDPKKLW
jgi:hypothetical protein